MDLSNEVFEKIYNERVQHGVSIKELAKEYKVGYMTLDKKMKNIKLNAIIAQNFLARKKY